MRGVADGVDRRHVARQILVDLHCAMLGAEVDPCGLEAQPPGVGQATCRDERLLGLDDRAIRERHVQRAVALFDDARRQAAEAENDARARHRVAQAVSHIVVEAAQNVRRAHDLRDLSAQALEERGEFNRDIAAADHEKAPRKHGQIEDLVGGDRVLEALDAIEQRRTGARRNEDMAGEIPPRRQARTRWGSTTVARSSTSLAPDRIRLSR